MARFAVTLLAGIGIMVNNTGKTWLASDVVGRKAKHSQRHLSGVRSGRWMAHVLITNGETRGNAPT
jgi:hypothetical protein